MTLRRVLTSSFWSAAGLACSLTRVPMLTAQSTADVARQATPSTVTIVTIGPGGDTLGLGSGFVVRATGVIITNYHVMRGAAGAVIRFASGETFDRVEALDADAGHDVAVLKIPGFGLPVLTPAAAVPPVGDKVIAIGAPRGLDFTVSEGIVSAIRMDEGKQWIQMSAPISPGSSGGPVLNGQGQVVGISTMYRTDGQNLNFAVPIKYAMGLVNTFATPRQLAVVFANGIPDQSSSGPEPAAVSLPAPAHRADATWLVDTYSVYGWVSTASQTAGTDRNAWSGLLLAAGEDAGLLLWRWSDTTRYGRAITPTIVSRLFATDQGRLLFTFDDWIHQGYFTERGGFVVASDTVVGSRAFADTLVGEPYQLDLSLSTGLYKLNWQSDYFYGVNHDALGVVTSWTGQGALAVIRDSVYAVLAMRNTNGGTTTFYASGPGREDDFVLTALDGSRLAGSLVGGQLRGSFKDVRGKDYFSGGVWGNRE